MYVYTDEAHIVPVAERLSVNRNPIEALQELAAAVDAQGVYTEDVFTLYMVIPPTKWACELGNTDATRLAQMCCAISESGEGLGGGTDPNEAWTGNQIYNALAVESSYISWSEDSANITDFLNKISDKPITGYTDKNDILQAVIDAATFLMTP